MFNLKIMKKIAVPITKNNTIGVHFGRSEFYEIYTFSDANEILDLQLLVAEPGPVCKSNITNVLSKMGVKYLLSDHIGDKAVNKLNNIGVNVVAGCKGNSADAILKFVNQ
jgi:predicted Fe-Mo cluster-binding NifX family protein